MFLLAATAVVFVPAAALSQQAGRIVPLTSAVKIAPSGKAPVSFLVARGVARVSVGVDGAALGVAGGGCSDGRPPDARAIEATLLPAKEGEATTVQVCVGASAAASGSGRLVVVGDDGSSATVPVTVTPPPSNTSDALAAPPTLQVVTPDESGELNVTPGFSLLRPLQAVAGGGQGTATVYLSSSPRECDDTEMPPPTDTATTSVHVLACGAKAVGTYTAKFDVNGDAAGGDLSVTVVRRLTRWWAAIAVASGLLIALAVDRLIALARTSADEAASETTLLAAEVEFKAIAADLQRGGTELSNMVSMWAPQRWDALTRGSTSVDPTPAAAGRLYARAAACVDPLVDLVRHFREQTPAGTPDGQLVVSALGELKRGITADAATETPTAIVGRLEAHAARAHLAVEEDRRLLRLVADETAPAAQREDARKRREHLAAAKLDQVDDVLSTAEAPEDPGRPSMYLTGLDMNRENRASAAGRSWDKLVVVASPTAGPPPNPARAVLRSRWAKSTALAIGLLLAAAAGMQDALDPTKAWGTLADFVKMFTAALTFPTLLDQARKLFAGGTPPG